MTPGRVYLDLLLCFGLMIFVVLAARPAECFSQSPVSPWTTVATLDSVEVSYIMYREADNYNNGVVVKLVNRRDYQVAYRFTIVFRSTGRAEESHETQGTLGPLEMKTGESSGLFWIPFTNGSQLSEVGVRGFSAERVEP